MSSNFRDDPDGSLLAVLIDALESDDEDRARAAFQSTLSLPPVSAAAQAMILAAADVPSDIPMEHGAPREQRAISDISSELPQKAATGPRASDAAIEALARHIEMDALDAAREDFAAIGLPAPREEARRAILAAAHAAAPRVAPQGGWARLTAWFFAPGGLVLAGAAAAAVLVVVATRPPLTVDPPTEFGFAKGDAGPTAWSWPPDATPLDREIALDVLSLVAAARRDSAEPGAASAACEYLLKDVALRASVADWVRDRSKALDTGAVSSLDGVSEFLSQSRERALKMSDDEWHSLGMAAIALTSTSAFGTAREAARIVVKRALSGFVAREGAQKAMLCLRGAELAIQGTSERQELVRCALESPDFAVRARAAALQ